MKCDICKETYYHNDELSFYDVDGKEIYYQDAMDCGYVTKKCGCDES